MDGAPRFQAARWVIRVGRLYAGLLALAATWSLIGAVFLGSPAVLVVAALLGTLSAAWSALLRAFTRHRRGARQLMLALAAAGALCAAVGWLGTRSPAAPGLLPAAGHLVVLTLLLHRDSREWVGVDAARGSAATSPSHG